MESLISKLEVTVDAIVMMADRYKMYKEYHAWNHTLDACTGWHLAVKRAHSIVKVLLENEQPPEEEYLLRLGIVLAKLKALNKETPAILNL